MPLLGRIIRGKLGFKFADEFAHFIARPFDAVDADRGSWSVFDVQFSISEYGTAQEACYRQTKEARERPDLEHKRAPLAVVGVAASMQDKSARADLHAKCQNMKILQNLLKSVRLAPVCTVERAIFGVLGAATASDFGRFWRRLVGECAFLTHGAGWETEAE
jgi:hypothetical protein